MAPQSKYITKLSGSRVLIIGGSSGIGFGIAEALIEYNAAFIAISSSNPDRVQSAVNKLKQAYPDAKTKIQGLACNLADQTSLENNVKKLFTDLDLEGEKLDHVAYTAGDSLAAKPLSEFDFSFAIQAGMVRFFGPMMVAKHAPAYLKPGPDASIILTTGSVSEKPIPNWTIVGSYAAGLQGLTRGLALDLKPLRINVVSPGAVDTELWHGIPEQARNELKESMIKGTSIGRIGRVEDLAESYLYLMRDGNVTGTMISSNGGALIV